MGICEICGNSYAKTIVIYAAGEAHTYDCFECAIQGLAPICAHCGCRIIGHGIESHNLTFCGSHCERMGIYDHASIITSPIE